MSREVRALLSASIGKEFEFGGYHFQRGTTPKEREVAYRLRYRVYAAEEFIDPSRFSDERFCDEFDDFSIHLLVTTLTGEPVGTTRFVLPSPLGFPIEQLFEFTPPAIPLERLGEFGRLAICPEHRGGTRKAMLGLIKMVWDCAVEHDVTHIYAFMPPALIASLARIGLDCHILPAAPPSRETLEHRRIMHGYFERADIQPAMFDRSVVRALLGF
jgi:N-acyl-L-homoserine lactone synthetase